jgi:hypothetical protein
MCVKEKKKPQKTYIEYKNGKFIRTTNNPITEQPKEEKKQWVKFPMFKKNISEDLSEQNYEEKISPKTEEKKKKQKKEESKFKKDWMINLALWLLITMVSLFLISAVYLSSKKEAGNRPPRESSLLSSFNALFSKLEMGSEEDGFYSEVVEVYTGEDVVLGFERLKERRREKIIDFDEFRANRRGLISELKKISETEKKLKMISGEMGLGENFKNELDGSIKLTNELLEMANDYKSSSEMRSKIQ